MNWILLRGLLREARHWYDFTECMKRSAQGEIVTLDLPGFGTQKDFNAPLTVKGNTEDLRKRWKTLKEKDPQKKWGLLGISFGGMISLDWVNRYPHDFNRLVVINSSSKDTGSPTQRFSTYGLQQAFLSLLKFNDALEREKEILKMVSNLRQNNPDVLKEFFQISQDSKISAKKALSQLLASSQFQLPLSIQIPMLILASKKDKLVDVNCSIQMAEKLNAQIEFHPTAGHDLTLDAPEWCVEKIF